MVGADIFPLFPEILGGLKAAQKSGFDKPPKDTLGIGLSHVFGGDKRSQLKLFGVCGAVPTALNIAAYALIKKYTVVFILSVALCGALTLVLCTGGSTASGATSALKKVLVLSEILTTGGLLGLVAEFGSIIGWSIAMRIFTTAAEVL